MNSMQSASKSWNEHEPYRPTYTICEVYDMALRKASKIFKNEDLATIGSDLSLASLKGLPKTAAVKNLSNKSYSKETLDIAERLLKQVRGLNEQSSSGTISSVTRAILWPALGRKYFGPKMIQAYLRAQIFRF